MRSICKDKKLCIGIGCFRLCFADPKSHSLICSSVVLLLLPALVVINGAPFAQRLPLMQAPVSSDLASSAMVLQCFPVEQS